MRRKMLFLALAVSVLLALLTVSAGAETVVPVRTEEEIFALAGTSADGTVLQLAAPEITLVWTSQRSNLMLANGVRIDLNGKKLVLSNVPLLTGDPAVGAEKPLVFDSSVSKSGSVDILMNNRTTTAYVQTEPEAQGWLPLLKNIRISGSYQPADVLIPKGVTLDVNGHKYQPTGTLTLCSGAAVTNSQAGGSCNPAEVLFRCETAEDLAGARFGASFGSAKLTISMENDILAPDAELQIPNNARIRFGNCRVMVKTAKLGTPAYAICSGDNGLASAIHMGAFNVITLDAETLNLNVFGPFAGGLKIPAPGKLDLAGTALVVEGIPFSGEVIDSGSARKGSLTFRAANAAQFADICGGEIKATGLTPRIELTSDVKDPEGEYEIPAGFVLDPKGYTVQARMLTLAAGASVTAPEKITAGLALRVEKSEDLAAAAKQTGLGGITVSGAVVMTGNMKIPCEIRINPDASLDLAGYTLVCSGLDAAGRVTDSGEGSGLLLCEKPVLPENNGLFLPMYDKTAGGWRLFRIVTNCRRAPRMLNGKVQFAFNFTFSNKTAYTLLKNGGSGVTVDFEVISDGKTVRTCTFLDSVVQEYGKSYAEKKGTFALCATFGDCAAWSGTEVYATPVLRSALGTSCRAGAAVNTLRIP